VPGGDYAEDALGIGGGVRPDLAGKGIGRHIIAAAMNFGLGRFRPTRYRVTVARFNERARRTCLKLGFSRGGSFHSEKSWRDFDIFARNAERLDLEIPIAEVDGPATFNSPARPS
jgi:RimJ/RimL family protein N-acetyltransferase